MILQFASTAIFYLLSLISAIFFVGVSSYNNAMVMDLKRNIDEHDDEMANTVKYQYFLDAITLHRQIFRLSFIIFEFIIFTLNPH